jgi:hypothetical protein
MRLFNSVLAAPVTLCLLVGTACTGSIDEGVGSEQAVETGVGKLRVNTIRPIGTAKIMAHRIRDSQAGDTIELTPNAEKDVPSGTYCVWTRLEGDVDTLKNCNVAVNPGARTDHVLGAVAFRRSRTDRVLGLDWPKPSAFATAVGAAASAVLIPNHASGTFSHGLGDLRVGFEIAPFAETPVDLSSTEATSFLRIVPARTRALPEAATDGMGLRIMNTEGNDALAMETLESLGAAGTPLLVRSPRPTEVLLAYQNCKSSCARKPILASARFALSEGDGTTLTLGRIEERELVFSQLPSGVFVKGRVDGIEPTIVAGTFDVSLGDKLLFGDLKLGTGVDVLPSELVGGAYRLTVRYKHPSDNLPVAESREVQIVP